MTEVWKNLDRFSGYAVSDLGRIRSLDRVGRGRYGDAWYKGRVLKLHLTPKSGHFRAALYCARGRFDCFIHRLVLEAFVGPCPKGMECRHLDGDPANNRLENLAWGTAKENSADCTRHGRRASCSGENNSQAKINEQCVRLIRQLYKFGGISKAEISQALRLSENIIYRVLSRRTWAHVDPVKRGSRPFVDKA